MNEDTRQPSSEFRDWNDLDPDVRASLERDPEWRGCKRQDFKWRWVLAGGEITWIKGPLTPKAERELVIRQATQSIEWAIGRVLAPIGPGQPVEVVGATAVDATFRDSGVDLESRPLALADTVDTVGVLFAHKFRARLADRAAIDVEALTRELVIDLMTIAPPFDEADTGRWVRELHPEDDALFTKVLVKWRSERWNKNPQDARRLIAPTEEAFREAIRKRLAL